MEYWNPRIELMPKEDPDGIQLRLFKALVGRLWGRSEFYHERMRDRDVRPEDIQSLENVTKLPFMNKADFRNSYPDLIFAEPQRRIVRYHASSGTTGKSTVVGYTRNDLGMWANSLGRALTSCSLGEDDVIQVSNGYGLFTGD